MRIVVKVGSSSLTDDDGRINNGAIVSLSLQIAEARKSGHEVVLVTSGAIAAGLPLLKLSERPKDTLTLQAAASVGQPLLMRSYDDALSKHGVVGGQILLTPYDFFERRQYLHAQNTLQRLMQLDVIPIINENDAISDDEIGFGDNDRLAALVANAVKADLLLLLTDAAGVFTKDPRGNDDAELIEDVAEVDASLLALAGGAGSNRGTGGMLSKLTAARMASWSGVPVVIAAAGRPDVISDAIGGLPVGTRVQAREKRLSAHKVWLAFALGPKGTVIIDNGAAAALANGKSLLLPGVTEVSGSFSTGDGVVVVDAGGSLVARGIAAFSSDELSTALDYRRATGSANRAGEVIHRDKLVLL